MATARVQATASASTKIGVLPYLTHARTRSGWGLRQRFVFKVQLVWRERVRLMLAHHDEVSRWTLNRADHNRGKRNLVVRTLDAVGLGFDS